MRNSDFAIGALAGVFLISSIWHFQSLIWGEAQSLRMMVSFYAVVAILTVGGKLIFEASEQLSRNQA